MADDLHRATPAGQRPLPRPPLPGPAGEWIHLAGAEDSARVAALLRQFLGEIRQSPEDDRVEWVAQTMARDPLRGLLVIAESAVDPPEVGLASISTSLDPVRGWVGWFTCLYVRPAFRRQGVGSWLMGETLEMARYHGINHICFETGTGDEIVRRILARLPLVKRASRLDEIDLHPHFDDGES